VLFLSGSGVADLYRTVIGEPAVVVLVHLGSSREPPGQPE
jgi:hypothetical protein